MEGGAPAPPSEATDGRRASDTPGSTMGARGGTAHPHPSQTARTARPARFGLRWARLEGRSRVLGSRLDVAAVGATSKRGRHPRDPRGASWGVTDRRPSCRPPEGKRPEPKPRRGRYPSRVAVKRHGQPTDETRGGRAHPHPSQTARAARPARFGLRWARLEGRPRVQESRRDVAAVGVASKRGRPLLRFGRTERSPTAGLRAAPKGKDRRARPEPSRREATRPAHG